MEPSRFKGGLVHYTVWRGLIRNTFTFLYWTTYAQVLFEFPTCQACVEFRVKHGTYSPADKSLKWAYWSHHIVGRLDFVTKLVEWIILCDTCGSLPGQRTAHGTCTYIYFIITMELKAVDLWNFTCRQRFISRLCTFYSVVKAEIWLPWQWIEKTVPYYNFCFKTVTADSYFPWVKLQEIPDLDPLTLAVFPLTYKGYSFHIWYICLFCQRLSLPTTDIYFVTMTFNTLTLDDLLLLASIFEIQANHIR